MIQDNDKISFQTNYHFNVDRARSNPSGRRAGGGSRRSQREGIGKGGEGGGVQQGISLSTNTGYVRDAHALQTGGRFAKPGRTGNNSIHILRNICMRDLRHWCSTRQCSLPATGLPSGLAREWGVSRPKGCKRDRGVYLHFSQQSARPAAAKAGGEKTDREAFDAWAQLRRRFNRPFYRISCRPRSLSLCSA